ncbi:MAG: hypothetical protein WDZ37_06765 [Solirubrobacterales bacterium]
MCHRAPGGAKGVLPTSGTLNTIDDKHLMSRIAAAIWAAIAFFAAVSTVGSLQPTGADLELMRGIAVSASVLAVATMLIAWERLPKAAFNVPLLLMTATIGALVYAEGAVRTDLTLLFAFLVVFAAYFLPWRSSAVQLALIASVLAVRLVTLDTSQATGDEAIRLVLLLPALAALAVLVGILRRNAAAREAVLIAQETYDYQTGLLSREELSRVMDAEVTRASQHARPLSLVMIDVSGEMLSRAEFEPQHRARIATMVARSLLGRIRVEDHAARFDEFRFAVLAPDTDGEGAAAFGRGLVDVVRKRLITLGYETESFAVALGWADYPHSAQSTRALIDVAAKGANSPGSVGDPSQAPSAEPPVAPAEGLGAAAPHA